MQTPEQQKARGAAAFRSIKLCDVTLEEPGHICAFFDSRSEKYDVLVPYFRDALDSGDRVINVVDGDRMSDHLRTLADADVPVDRARSTGQMTILSSEETYLKTGTMDLEGMLGLLREALTDAQRENRCVRTCGEMDWVARSRLSAQKVLEYEAKVNYFVPDFACTLLCVYDLARTPAGMVSDILATHGYAIVKGRLRPNPYHVKPDEYLEMLRARH